MHAVDTNVLIFAHSQDTPYHETARELLESMARSPTPWAIPWPCLYEFLRVATHPRILARPASQASALEALAKLTASPSLRLLGHTPRHAGAMQQVMHESGATGNIVHDAHIAALCIEHGATRLVTGDRDFMRFPGIEVVNPFA